MEVFYFLGWEIKRLSWAVRNSIINQMEIGIESFPCQFPLNPEYISTFISTPSSPLFFILLLHLLFILCSFQTTKAFLPRMLELQHGHVVCINSILSKSPIPGAIDYCTSKASSLAFMESLTLGLLDCPGVGCTTVLPFHTNTEMFQGMRVRYVKLFVPTTPLSGNTFGLKRSASVP